MNWTTRADGHEYAKYRKVHLRLKHIHTGWIISREDCWLWVFVAGDVRREVAIRKAMEVLNG